MEETLVPTTGSSTNTTRMQSTKDHATSTGTFLLGKVTSFVRHVFQTTTITKKEQPVSVGKESSKYGTGNKRVTDPKITQAAIYLMEDRATNSKQPIKKYLDKAGVDLSIYDDDAEGMTKLCKKVSAYADRFPKKQTANHITKPTTKMFRERFKNTLNIKSDHILKNAVNGTSMVTFLKNVVPMQLIGTLMTSTLTLLKEVNVAVKRCSRSEKSEVLHIGQWIWQGGDTIKLTKDTKTHFQACKAWIQKNQKLFNLISTIFEQQQPVMFKKYMSIVDKYELQLGPFSCVALNLNFGKIDRHKDTKDVQEGYCWVLPWGNWNGGLLTFPELNVSVDSKAGDLTGFLSSALVHEVTAYSGYRYSLTCFTHQQNFFTRSNKEERGIYDKPLGTVATRRKCKRRNDNGNYKKDVPVCNNVTNSKKTKKD